MLIAVDHGNHAIKTIHYNFISGLAPATARDIFWMDIQMNFQRLRPGGRSSRRGRSRCTLPEVRLCEKMNLTIF